MKKILYVDGGGTKTIGFLVHDKKIISSKTSGAGNIDTNWELTKNNIVEIINHVGHDFDEIHLGLAGALISLDKDARMIEFLKQEYKKEVFLTTDLLLVSKLCFQNTDKNPKLLINLGTGTAIIHFDNYKYRTILGWGKYIGDFGSGYDIGLNVIQYLCKAEDLSNFEDKYYQKFLKDFNANSMREYIHHFNDPKNVSKLSLWISEQGEKAVYDFVIPRVKYTLDYVSKIETDDIYCIGSIFTKNKIVQEYTKNYYKNKKVTFTNFEECLMK